MTPLPDPSLPWPICLSAVSLIADAEGLRLRAYKCPAGVWTIGRGRTEGVTPGLTCTVEQADRWLCDELTARAAAVTALLTEHADPNQLGALVSLHYNIGAAAFAKSTVLKAHNAGYHQAAARAFGLWNKARVGGVLTVLPGLTARRAAEAALYLKPEPDAPVEKMPQAVQAESPLAASPIAQSGAATAGAGALVGLGGMADQLGPVGDLLAKLKGVVVETLGIAPDQFLPVVLVMAGVAVVWQRLKQRRGGWC